MQYAHLDSPPQTLEHLEPARTNEKRTEDTLEEEVPKQLTEAWHRREVDRPIAETLAQQMWDRSQLLDGNVQGTTA